MELKQQLTIPRTFGAWQKGPIPGRGWGWPLSMAEAYRGNRVREEKSASRAIPWRQCSQKQTWGQRQDPGRDGGQASPSCPELGIRGWRPTPQATSTWERGMWPGAADKCLEHLQALETQPLNLTPHSWVQQQVVRQPSFQLLDVHKRTAGGREKGATARTEQNTSLSLMDSNLVPKASQAPTRQGLHAPSSRRPSLLI